MFHTEHNSPHKRVSVPYEPHNTIYVCTYTTTAFRLIQAHSVPGEVRTECNADTLFVGGSTSRETSSILIIPRLYNCLNNANPCIVGGSERLSAANCCQNEHQLIYLPLNWKNNSDNNAVTPFGAVRHPLTPFVETHICWTHKKLIFLKKSVTGLCFIKSLSLTNISQCIRSVRLGPIRFGVRCECFHYIT